MRYLVRPAIPAKTNRLGQLIDAIPETPYQLGGYSRLFRQVATGAGVKQRAQIKVGHHRFSEPVMKAAIEDIDDAMEYMEAALFLTSKVEDNEEREDWEVTFARAQNAMDKAKERFEFRLSTQFAKIAGDMAQEMNQEEADAVQAVVDAVKLRKSKAQQ